LNWHRVLATLLLILALGACTQVAGQGQAPYAPYSHEGEGDYNGPNLRDALAKFGDWTIEIVKRAADATGFQLLPRRWVVERTLAWLNRNGRLAKDFEASIASAKAWVYIASVQLLVRRLA
jgi:hypothetical protein